MGCSQSQQAQIKEQAEKAKAQHDAKQAKILKRGETRESENKKYRIVHQDDGNVVVYHGEVAKWATDTAGKATTQFILQDDGNLVLYNEAEALWASNTVDSKAEKIILQNDGNLVVYDAAGKAVWASNTVDPEAAAAPAPAPAPEPVAPAFELKRGEEVFSDDGRYKIVHQNDGNVVVYHVSSGAPKWATNTNGKDSTTFVLQGDGNLVLYNNGEALWASNTVDSKAAKAIIQNDGNFVLYTADGAAPWATNTAVPARSQIGVDEVIYVNDTLDSANGAFRLILQVDGNFVLYKGAHAKWASDTHGKDSNGAKVLLQGDGNLVLYNSSGAIWAASCNHEAPSRAVLQDDGNFVVYDANGEAKWATNTNE